MARTLTAAEFIGLINILHDRQPTINEWRDYSHVKRTVELDREDLRAALNNSLNRRAD